MRRGLQRKSMPSVMDLRFVHSSNEPLLVAGVGTAALELLESAPDLDVIFVPVGGGSGVLGRRCGRTSRQPGDQGHGRAG